MHSISNHTQFYRNLDYSLYREVLSRKGEMGGARDRGKKNQVYNKLKLAKSLLTNPSTGCFSASQTDVFALNWCC